MSDLPQPDSSETADRRPGGPTTPDPAATDPAATADAAPTGSPAAPAVSGRRRPPAPATLALGAIAVALALYGTAGFLRETGLYDVSRLWSKPAAAPTLAALSGPPAAPAAPSSRPSPAPFPAAPGNGGGGSLRDQPPRPPSTDLPQFTVRDGEARDYLTDLDAETLKRLAEVQGQLDGLGAQVAALRQGMQALASAAGQQRQQEAAHQDRLQRELAAARAELAALLAPAVGRCPAGR